MAINSKFGFWTLACLVIANMIGAGVFTTSGYALAGLEQPAWVLVAWVVAGMIAICGAFSYGMLVRASRAAHPALGFIAGWVSLIVGFTGAIALAAITLEQYVFFNGQRPSWLPEDLVACGVVLIGALAHGFRVRWGAKIQNTAVLLKIGFVILFLAAAYFSWRNGQWPDSD